ncbi:hypothetical protein VTP01DRAFT_8983 [Rhizomucor pusillus]|uniref:uncharacterized protein n=1 Tax=Rhizomucor pusillus TaxID=4840 RepID=UPI0037428A2B
MHRIAVVPRIVLAQRQRLLASPAPPLLTRCYSSKIANKTFPPEAPDPEESFESQSMLASFKNMFDRGPNVGVEIITKQGFVLSNNVQVNQPLVLLNGSAFLWQPPKDVFQGNETESFKIFEVASPKPELLLVGMGKNFTPLPPNIKSFFYKLGIQVDQMSTKHAASTYNVLAEEGRRVAAILLPLQTSSNE